MREIEIEFKNLLTEDEYNNQYERRSRQWIKYLRLVKSY